MNGSIKSRLEKLEQEQRFQEWFESMRLLESFSEEQLDEFCQNEYLSGPYPDPPAQGQSELDHLGRKTLVRMWQENERAWAGRSKEEKDFYIRHGHWQEQACRGPECGENGEGDANVRNTKGA